MEKRLRENISYGDTMNEHTRISDKIKRYVGYVRWYLIVNAKLILYGEKKN